jgi:hypothetical protein
VSGSAVAVSDLGLISILRSIPDPRMRRGVRIPSWILLLVPEMGILSRCQSLRDLERYLEQLVVSFCGPPNHC